ncbi:MAG: PP2C family protein-serine/threonine phosphatase, partial [Caulobacteraceae bacterium]
MSRPSPERIAAANPAIRLSWTGRTHVGAVRTRNEDCYLARPDIGLFAVADGMGGHQAGDVASALVIDTLARLVRPASGHAYLKEVRDQLQGANARLLERAARLPAAAVIGSTVVALIFYQDHYACLWAGDSRAYLHRRGRLTRISRDHSFVQAMMDAGQIDERQARVPQRRHLITRAVGAGHPLALDAVYATVETDDTYLLCSDGVTDML